MTTADLIDEPISTALAPPLRDGRERRPRPTAKKRSLLWTLTKRGFGLLVVAGSLAALFITGYLPKLEQAERLHKAAADARSLAPRVALVTPRRADSISSLILPGDIQAIRETAIHARTDGYLKRWLVDIGDHVKEGQVLAEIDTPEIDQSLKEAQATVAQSEANVVLAKSRLELSKLNLGRSRALRTRGAATNQELDEDNANFEVAEATLEAAKAEVTAKRASVHRLTDLQSFQKVAAPFDGVITLRNVDAGALISSSGNGRGSELFRVAQTDTLRIFVNVPQAYVSSVAIGQETLIQVREYAGRKFSGKVVRTSGAIDPTSRTLRTEIHVPNQDQSLYSGMYVQVVFVLKSDNPPLVVSANTVLVGAEGTRVAVLGPGKTVHYESVVLGRDFGSEIEVLSGLNGSERLIADPGDNLPEGSRVEPATPMASSTPKDRKT